MPSSDVLDATWVSMSSSQTINREGNLIDTMLSATRDLAAAKAFFNQAIVTVGHKPERVTTDKHAAYPRAMVVSGIRL